MPQRKSNIDPRGPEPFPGRWRLTAKQRDLLYFIKDYMARYGEPPTREEIQEHYGVGELIIYKRIRALERHGYLKRTTKQARNLVILKMPEEPKPKPFRRRPYLVKYHLQRDHFKKGLPMINIFHFWKNPDKKKPIDNPLPSTSVLQAMEWFRVLNVLKNSETGRIRFVNPTDDYNKIELDRNGILLLIDELKQIIGEE